VNMKAVRVGVFAVLTFALAGAAVADRIEKTRVGNRHCLKVWACPGGRQANDTRSIYDFHVQVVGGTVISHSSPTEWGGHHAGSAANWKTTTRPIRYTAGGTCFRSGFCIRVNGGTRLTWWTTAKDGSTIAQGSVNLP